MLRWSGCESGAASAAVCAIASGCSSAQPQPQASQSTAAVSVAQSTPAKVARAKQGEGNAITVDFMYPPGDPHWTDEAKAALHEAANALVADIVAPKPVTITYKLGTDENPDNLAQASSDRVNLESPGYFRTVVQQKLITGEDANGDEPDGDIDINWKADWALGDSVTPGPGRLQGGDHARDGGTRWASIPTFRALVRAGDEPPGIRRVCRRCPGGRR